MRPPNAELKFGQWTMLRGEAFAAQHRLDTATTDLQVVEGSAVGLGSVIARIPDREDSRHDKLYPYPEMAAQLRWDGGGLCLVALIALVLLLLRMNQLQPITTPQ